MSTFTPNSYHRGIIYRLEKGGRIVQMNDEMCKVYDERGVFKHNLKTSVISLLFSKGCVAKGPMEHGHFVYVAKPAGDDTPVVTEGVTMTTMTESDSRPVVLKDVLALRDELDGLGITVSGMGPELDKFRRLLDVAGRLGGVDRFWEVVTVLGQIDKEFGQPKTVDPAEVHKAIIEVRQAVAEAEETDKEEAKDPDRSMRRGR
jgi:hypothetical protein